MQIELFTQEGELVFSGESTKLYVAGYYDKESRSQIVRELGNGGTLYEKAHFDFFANIYTKRSFTGWSLFRIDGRVYRIPDEGVPKKVLAMELLLA